MPYLDVRSGVELEARQRDEPLPGARQRPPTRDGRARLGAGHGRLARQLLVEASMYGVAGGALGLALGFAGVLAIQVFAGVLLPRIDEVAVNPRIALAALVLGLTTGVLGGMLPILCGPRSGLSSSLRDGSARSGESPWHGRVRKSLVVVEIAMTVTVLVGAGLFLRTLTRLESVDPGFAPERVLTFRLSLTGERYRDPDRMVAPISASGTSRRSPNGSRSRRRNPGSEAASSCCSRRSRPDSLLRASTA